MSEAHRKLIQIGREALANHEATSSAGFMDAHSPGTAAEAVVEALLESGEVVTREFFRRRLGQERAPLAQLGVERDRYREALEKIVAGGGGPPDGVAYPSHEHGTWKGMETAAQIARRALGGWASDE